MGAYTPDPGNFSQQSQPAATTPLICQVLSAT